MIVSKIGYVVIAVVVAVVAGVYYFLFYKKSTVIAAAPSDLGQTESTQRADYDMETPLVVIGEQISPTVAVPIISGTTFVATPAGDVVGVGGYYDKMVIAISETLGVPVATTSTGATVAVPTDPTITSLERDEYGRFVNPTAEQQEAISQWSFVAHPDVADWAQGLTYTEYHAELAHQTAVQTARQTLSRDQLIYWNLRNWVGAPASMQY